MKTLRQVITGIVSFASFVLVTNCAPKVQEKQRVAPIVPTVRTNDTNLFQKNKKSFASFEHAQKNIKKSSQNLFIDAENLLMISDKLQDTLSEEIALSYYNQAIANQTTASSSVLIKDTHYLQLVHEESVQAIQSGTATVIATLQQDVVVIQKLITRETEILKTVKENDLLGQQLELVEKVLQKIIVAIESADIFPDLKLQVVTEMRNQSAVQLTGPKILATDLKVITTLKQGIDILNAYVVKNTVVLLPEDKKALTDADHLGQLVDKIRNSKTALQALAKTWQILKPEERVLHFKTANKKLFDFFNDKGPRDIQCIVAANCDSFVTKIILKMGVYPAIEEYGVENIKKDITLNALNSLNLAVQKNSQITLLALGQTLQTDVQEGVNKEIIEIQLFAKDFKNYIAEGLAAKLGTASIGRLNLSTSNANNFMLNYYNSLFLKKNNERGQFQLIDNLLQFMFSGKNLDQTSDQNNSEAKITQTIKEALTKADARFYYDQENKLTAEPILTVKDQAASLKFYTQMMNQLADWRPSTFDTGITQYYAQDLVTKFHSEDLKKLVFPKADLFGMALSLAAQTLKQLESELSPIYLLDGNNQRISIYDYLNNNFENPNAVVVHAAASDLKNKVLSDETKLEDITLMIDALADFYKATEDIEKSTSDILKDEVLKTQILNSRKQVKLVIVTLANFISNQMVTRDHYVYSEMNFKTTQKKLSVSSMDYAMAIKALMTAHHVTGIDIYKLSALEVYYSLNRKFYLTKNKFYSSSIQTNDKGELVDADLIKSDSADISVSRDHILMMLSSILPLRSHMNYGSQLQFDRIFENWYSVLLL